LKERKEPPAMCAINDAVEEVSTEKAKSGKQNEGKLKVP
jgi:hypothetical protein